jgi:hypothetical protein
MAENERCCSLGPAGSRGDGDRQRRVGIGAGESRSEVRCNSAPRSDFWQTIAVDRGMVER